MATVLLEGFEAVSAGLPKGFLVWTTAQGTPATYSGISTDYVTQGTYSYKTSAVRGSSTAIGAAIKAAKGGISTSGTAYAIIDVTLVNASGPSDGYILGLGDTQYNLYGPISDEFYGVIESNNPLKSGDVLLQLAAGFSNPKNVLVYADNLRSEVGELVAASAVSSILSFDAYTSSSGMDYPSGWTTSATGAGQLVSLQKNATIKTTGTHGYEIVCSGAKTVFLRQAATSSIDISGLTPGGRYLFSLDVYVSGSVGTGSRVGPQLTIYNTSSGAIDQSVYDVSMQITRTLDYFPQSQFTTIKGIFRPNTSTVRTLDNTQSIVVLSSSNAGHYKVVLDNFIVSEASVSTQPNTYVDPPTTEFTLTAYPPTTFLSKEIVDLPTAGFDITTYPPRVAANELIYVPSTNFEFTSYAPELAVDQIVLLDTAEFELTGYAPSTYIASFVDPHTKEFTVTTYAPELYVPWSKTYPVIPVAEYTYTLKGVNCSCNFGSGLFDVLVDGSVRTAAYLLTPVPGIPPFLVHWTKGAACRFRRIRLTRNSAECGLISRFYEGLTKPWPAA